MRFEATTNSRQELLICIRGPIGIELMNPDAELRALDGRVISCIEETLHIESFPINMGDGRWVLAVRVPNSTTKPHSVRFRGRIFISHTDAKDKGIISTFEISRKW